MALDFTNNVSDRIECGTAASVSDITKGTIISWVYPTASPAALSILMDKRSTGAAGYRFFRYDSAEKLEFSLDRATDLNVASKNKYITLNAWQFIALTFDTAGVDGDQALFRGTLTADVTECALYSAQTVGEDPPVSDAADSNLHVGSSLHDLYSWRGRIAVFAIFSGVILTLAQLKEQQFRPHITGDCVLFLLPGLHGTGTQPDLSGTGNDGTVTGATVAPHVPLFHPFGSDIGLPYTVTIAGAEIVQIGQASMTHVGQSVNVNAAEDITITKGSIALVGQAVVSNMEEVITITKGAIALAAKAVNVNIKETITITKGAIALVGQPVLALGADVVVIAKAAISAVGQAVNVNIKEAITITKGAIALAGQALTIVEDTIVTITKGTISLVGKALGVNEGAVALKRIKTWLYYYFRGR
jgi:hypothetical protein